MLIKGYDARGIVWYTNYDSRKGRELAGNPHAALQFHWVELERVVRIEGRVEKVDGAESDAYYQSRPLDSRIGAWASPQSQVIASRAVLVANAALRRARNTCCTAAPAALGAASGWCRIAWEFWQAASRACIDRLRYRLDEAGTWGARAPAPDSGLAHACAKVLRNFSTLGATTKAQ